LGIYTPAPKKGIPVILEHVITGEKHEFMSMRERANFLGYKQTKQVGRALKNGMLLPSKAFEPDKVWKIYYCIDENLIYIYIYIYIYNFFYIYFLFNICFRIILF
jgi:hypothetical protein